MDAEDFKLLAPHPVIVTARVKIVKRFFMLWLQLLRAALVTLVF
jgi:hypothetical protein